MTFEAVTSVCVIALSRSPLLPSGTGADKHYEDSTRGAESELRSLT